MTPRTNPGASSWLFLGSCFCVRRCIGWSLGDRRVSHSELDVLLDRAREYAVVRKMCPPGRDVIVVSGVSTGDAESLPSLTIRVRPLLLLLSGLLVVAISIWMSQAAMSCNLSCIVTVDGHPQLHTLLATQVAPGVLKPYQSTLNLSKEKVVSARNAAFVTTDEVIICILLDCLVIHLVGLC